MPASFPLQVQRYRQRISGPLLDRIDLHIEVPAVEYRDIASTRAEEGSEAIRDRVGRARERQQMRFCSGKKVNCNARMGPRQIKQHCQRSDESQELIRVAMTELNLSARAYDRILKVSRTVADLEGTDDITTEHVSEAIPYGPSTAHSGFRGLQLPSTYASSSSSSSVVRPVMSGSSLSMAASIAARFFSCNRRIFSSTVSRVISL